ncbi:hypothetical protein KM043_017407 [Ampulex compressa]|nr:hypothetical protein KM043_017407 [Ampulex compressa]
MKTRKASIGYGGTMRKGKKRENGGARGGGEVWADGEVARGRRRWGGGEGAEAVVALIGHTTTGRPLFRPLQHPIGRLEFSYGQDEGRSRPATALPQIAEIKCMS